MALTQTEERVAPYFDLHSESQKFGELCSNRYRLLGGKAIRVLVSIWKIRRKERKPGNDCGTHCGWSLSHISQESYIHTKGLTFKSDLLKVFIILNF